jgi:hypothetical protein
MGAAGTIPLGPTKPRHPVACRFSHPVESLVTPRSRNADSGAARLENRSEREECGVARTRKGRGLYFGAGLSFGLHARCGRAGRSAEPPLSLVTPPARSAAPAVAESEPAQHSDIGQPLTFSPSDVNPAWTKQRAWLAAGDLSVEEFGDVGAFLARMVESIHGPAKGHPRVERIYLVLNLDRSESARR